MALIGHDQPRCRCRLVEVKRTSRFRWLHPTPACSATKVTLAPADDGASRLNRCPAIGNMLVPTVMNWFDEPANNVNPVGVEDLGDGKTPVGSS